jgi:hypothetical protein
MVSCDGMSFGSRWVGHGLVFMHTEVVEGGDRTYLVCN